MSKLKSSKKPTAAEVHPAQRTALCQRWLAAACTHMRQRLVMATQVRQAKAAGLTDEEALMSVEPTQVEVTRAYKKLAQVEGEAEGHNLRLPIEVLTAQGDLGDDDRDILVLAVAPQVDVEIRDAIARFNDNLLANYVDVRLCVEFLRTDPVERLGLRGHFAPDASLRRLRLVALEKRDAGGDNLLGYEVTPAPRALQLLLGDQGLLDVSMSGIAEFRRSQVRLDQVILPAGDLDPMLTLLDAWSRRAQRTHAAASPFSMAPGLVVEVSGPPGTGKTMLVDGLAHHLDRPILEIDASRLTEQADIDVQRALLSSLDQARLIDAIVVLDGVDGLLAKGNAKVDVVQESMRGHPGLVILTSRDTATLDSNLDRFIVQRLILDTPGPVERKRIFDLHVPDGVAFEDDAAITALAGQFTFPGALIRNAMQVATNRAFALSPDAPVIGAELLKKACYEQIRASLDEYAVRKKVGLTLEDLIVPTETRDDIEEMFVAARQRSHVLHNWGFAQKMSTGKGIVALFSGEPGVGKTLCATILANEMDQQLFQIAIPRVISKWIGETEKNIEKIFETAKASHGILLFDEADSLFASRTKVDSSVDRYSNMATNMLLQEIENFDGIVILTTNLEKNIDKAFQRRIGFKIHFPFPEAPYRAKIWRTLVPRTCPVDPALDWEELGLRFELSGGHIKNAVLRAAYQGSADNDILRFKHFEYAARQECKNAGKVFRSSVGVGDLF
ncbi:MAG: ATP-binding protein [Deltaproteobacteria bacterium]|nr:ATP-binding protein [Deltaproteobacteria bacterium]